MFLLDANVLLALADASHSFHVPAWSWFQPRAKFGWATCPLTENALLRIMGQSTYPKGPGAPEQVLPFLHQMRRVRGHQFWPDEISFSDGQIFGSLRNLSSRQLTDVYLLGLARHRSEKFATFDQRIPIGAVQGGAAHLEIIPVL